MGTSIDEQIDAVCHQVRRELLHTLLVEYRNGAGEIPLEPFRRRPDGTDGSVSLHHRHLPKLEALGLVAVDGDRDCVVPGKEFSEIIPLLECLHTTSGIQTPMDSSPVTAEESRQPTVE